MSYNIYLGNNIVDNIYLGNTEITEADLLGSKLNQNLTGFEDWYLVTKETHELLKTKETSEQLKVVETPNFLLTITGEIITTKETKEPLIYK